MLKIVRIHGGLGNQMFQYALAVALCQHNPHDEIYIDASCMNGYGLHNGFELNRIFTLNIPQAPWFKILSVGIPLPHYRLWQIGSRIVVRHTVVKDNIKDGFDTRVFEPRNMLLEGGWQTYRYFSDYRTQVLEAFTFPALPADSPNRQIIDRINGNVSVGVHIRRGDYVKISNTQGICSLEYYRQAIQLITQKTRPNLFLIFSDDINWCRENITEYLGDIPAEYVDCNKGNQSFRDMQLMSLCTHNIIANSSFSWWGAWLNQNPEKIVIAPSRWMNNGECPDIVPPEWIKIQV